MSKSLDDEVRAYEARGMISEEDKDMVGPEFDKRYSVTLGRIEEKLLEDLRELATPLINSYRSSLSPVFISSVIPDIFYGTENFSGLLSEVKGRYIELRIDGNSEEPAFDRAVQPLIDLIHEVRQRTLGNQIYSRIKAYLDHAVEKPSKMVYSQPKYEEVHREQKVLVGVAIP